MKIRELIGMLAHSDIDPESVVSMYVDYNGEYDEEIILQEVLHNPKVGPTVELKFSYNFPDNEL